MKLEGRLWIASAGDPLAGQGRIDLLAAIDACGSISQAAKALGISYKAAWDAVDTMNNLAGSALVERSTGGRGGGGTRLTERGERLVHAFRLIEAQHQRFLDSVGAHIDDFADTYQTMQRLNMKTSARNQLYGQVSAIKTGAVNDEIEVTLPGEDRLVATITSESTAHLGLRAGSEVVALIKAPWVMLAGGNDDLKLSAQNRLRGSVVRLTRGAVNAEVVIQLPGGSTVCAIVSLQSVDELALRVGEPAVAVFNAAHVILGVPSS